MVLLDAGITETQKKYFMNGSVERLFKNEVIMRKNVGFNEMVATSKNTPSIT